MQGPKNPCARGVFGKHRAIDRLPGRRYIRGQSKEAFKFPIRNRRVWAGMGRDLKKGGRMASGTSCFPRTYQTMRWGWVDSPMWSRIVFTVPASLTKAMIRIEAWQIGHCSGKAS